MSITRQPRLTKAKAAALYEKLVAFQKTGITQKEAAVILGRTRASIASFCSNNKIYGWPQGAAARNQYGHNNPNYTGGVSRGTITRYTKEVLLSAKRDLYSCERCGAKRKIPWPRHHKDRDRRNNSLDNLEVLCCACHNKEHMSERSRDNRGRLLCLPL